MPILIRILVAAITLSLLSAPAEAGKAKPIAKATQTLNKSSFNQSETLSSNVQKKMDDTVSAQQQKIG
jgi:hypothetical protein